MRFGAFYAWGLRYYLPTFAFSNKFILAKVAFDFTRRFFEKKIKK